MYKNLKVVKAKLSDIIFETDPVHISYVVKEEFKIHVISTSNFSKSHFYNVLSFLGKIRTCQRP